MLKNINYNQLSVIFHMQKTLRLIYLSFVLLSVSVCLPLHLSIRSTHQLSVDEQKAIYYNALAEYQTKLSKNVAEAKQEFEFVQSNISAVGAKQNLEQVIYNEGIDKLREDYLNMLEGLSEVQKLRIWECRNLTQQQIDRVQIQIKALQDQFNKLNQYQVGDCVRDQEIKFQKELLKQQIKNLQSKFSKTCDPPRKIYFIPNLNSEAQSSLNYIYGNQTEEQYEQSVQKLKNSGELVSTCPNDSPYVIDGKCQACQFYNVGEGKCQDGCQEAQYYDQQKHQCKDKIWVSNLQKGINYIKGQQQNNNETNQDSLGKSLTCSQETPYASINNTCISCQSQQVFDLESKTCVVCPNNTKYNETGHQCSPVPISVSYPECPEQTQFWNGTDCLKCESPGQMKGLQCVCPDDYFYHWNLLECRPRAEICLDPQRYWNGTMCIKCIAPGTFTYKNLSCNCPETYTYNYKVQKCLFGDGSYTMVPNIVNSSNWIYGQQGKQGYQQYITEANENKTAIQCPTDTPFPNKEGLCVICGVGELYDFTKKSCTQCGDKAQFNQTTHSCIPLTVPEQDIDLKCTQNDTFWNGTGCVKCQSPAKFTNNTCVCQGDMIYEWNEETCIDKPKLYVANFVSSNWVYGSLSETEYKQYLNSISSDYKVEKCPEQTPFPSNSQDCIVCPQDKIFDLSTGFCKLCEDGNEFNSTVHKCQKIQKQQIVCPKQFPYVNGTACVKCEDPGVWNKQNKTCICPEKKFYDLQLQVCKDVPVSIKNSNSDALNYYGQMPGYSDILETCPSEKPFFNGYKCIQCETPQYFDFGKKICTQCDQLLVFDIASKSCIAQTVEIKSYNSLLNLEQSQNYCCNPPSSVKEIQNCPNDKPFFNKVECISCESPSFFNFEKAQCEQCSGGKVFNNIIKQCSEPVDSQIQYMSFLSGNANNYAGSPITDVTTEQTVTKSCPENIPFFDGKFCVACNSPAYFDFSDNKCKSCEQNQQFNGQERTCKQIQIKFNSNLKSENYVGKVTEYEEKYKTCDEDTPYFNGQKCIECKLPSYFNMTSSVCENCGENYFFNLVNGKCESKDIKFITDIKNPNLFFNGDFQKAIANYELALKGNPNIQNCPNDTPFYASNLQKCISCPEQKPIFNLHSNECMQCRDDSYFDSDLHTCTSLTIYPTIERMLMNIFGIL